MKFPRTAAAALLGLAPSAEATFERTATFFVCSQLHPNCDTDVKTNAETLWVTKDASTLVYSDAEAEKVGFVDIADPSNPGADGTVDLGGEPTTVRVLGNYAVVGVNTSTDFEITSGKLVVIDIASQAIVHEIELGGQPDAIEVSPDEGYIAVAIENERDEDKGDGAPPQMPAGFLVIIGTEDPMPSGWTTSTVDLTDLPGIRFPEDPEPEYVAINEDNIVAITLQENNAVVLVDLETEAILNTIDAGEVIVDQIDMTEEGIINQVESDTLFREPDGVTWIGTEYFATANEGDLDGGSRGFTIFDTDGNVVYDSGNEMELETARVGHYPEERSENKGNEPENVLYSEFDDGSKFLVVLSERSSLIFVYDASDPTSPSLLQVLPAGTAPEGIVAIPSRNLLVVASEEDDRGDKIRSSITIYSYKKNSAPVYPTLVSDSRPDGTPIPFAALSGLASASPNILYSIEDSFFRKSRIFKIDTSSFPAVITDEMRIKDSDDKLSDCLDGKLENGVLVSDMINEEDMTVNIDPEGIAVSKEGGFWLASEGRGTVNDVNRPFEYPNLLLRLDDSAAITKCVLLPDSFPDQLRFGFEGVAEDGDHVVVTIQRAWGGEDFPRLAVYNQATKVWKYAFYPLDAPESQNGGWVGLSDIAPLGNGRFLVLERDNQGSVDAAIKRIYQIDLGDFSFEDGTIVEKTLFRDVYDDLAATNGAIIEKVEGLAVTRDGTIWMNSDNDGVDDSSGEQLLINLGRFKILANSCAQSAKPGCIDYCEENVGSCVGPPGKVEDGTPNKKCAKCINRCVKRKCGN